MIVGVGVDLVEIPRIENAMLRPRFLSRIYTAREQIRIQRKGAATAAGYWAAKEAAMKALGIGMAVPFSSIGVVNDPKGKPMLEFTGSALDRAIELGVTVAHVSITHSKQDAAAFVVLERLEL